MQQYLTKRNLSIGILVLALIGLGVVLYLVRQNQELREQAAPGVCQVREASCNWDPLAGTVTYVVTVTSDGTTIKTERVPHPTTQLLFPAEPGKNYKCAVRAENSCGSGPSSESSQSTCPVPTAAAPPPAAPAQPAAPIPSGFPAPVELSFVVSEVPPVGSPATTTPTTTPTPTIAATASPAPTTTPTTTPGTTSPTNTPSPSGGSLTGSGAPGTTTTTAAKLPEAGMSLPTIIGVASGAILLLAGLFLAL